MSRMLPKSSGRLIVASAAKFEVLPLLQLLDCTSVSYTYLEIGIGAIRSALLAGRLREVVMGRCVLFVGSCGSSAAFEKPHLVAARAVSWNPSDVRHMNSYLVANAEPSLELSTFKDRLGLPHAHISCAGSIALTHESPKATAEELTYENLELYSVATAWHGHAAKIYALLGVTNQIGPMSQVQWRQNFFAVSQLTARFFADHPHQLLSMTNGATICENA